MKMITRCGGIIYGIWVEICEKYYLILLSLFSHLTPVYRILYAGYNCVSGGGGGQIYCRAQSISSSLAIIINAGPKDTHTYTPSHIHYAHRNR